MELLLIQTKLNLLINHQLVLLKDKKTQLKTLIGKTGILIKNLNSHMKM